MLSISSLFLSVPKCSLVIASVQFKVILPISQFSCVFPAAPNCFPLIHSASNCRLLTPIVPLPLPQDESPHGGSVRRGGLPKAVGGLVPGLQGLLL